MAIRSQDTTFSKIIALLRDAVPQNLKKKLPYEEAVEMISSRLVWLLLQANPDNAAILFVAVYNAMSSGRVIFSHISEERILDAATRRLGLYETYSSAHVESLLQFYNKGIPYSTFIQFMDPLLYQRSEAIVSTVINCALKECSDIDPDDLDYVMRHKIPRPAPRLLGS